MDDRETLDFDRQLAGQVYIAVSDGLTRWAGANDRLHLFELGSTRFAHQREASLNGDWRLGFTSRPCLGFSDWRMVGTWWLYDCERPYRFERAIRRTFTKMLDRFDFREVHGAKHASNGETEILRLKPDVLVELPGLIEGQQLKGTVGIIAGNMLELLIADIGNRML